MKCKCGNDEFYFISKENNEENILVTVMCTACVNKHTGKSHYRQQKIIDRLKKEIERKDEIIRNAGVSQEYRESVSYYTDEWGNTTKTIHEMGR